MELEQVHKYVERYLESDTTLEEEQVLYAYFSQSSVDETLAHYKPYFAAIAQQREQRFTRNFDSSKKSKPLPLKRISAVAAAAIAGVFILHQATKPPTLTTEEIAFQEFKTNMYLVAEQLNKGKQGVAYIETFNQTTNKYLKKD